MMMTNVAVQAFTGTGPAVADRSTASKKSNKTNGFDILLGNSIGSGISKDIKVTAKAKAISRADSSSKAGPDNTGAEVAAGADINLTPVKANDNDAAGGLISNDLPNEDAEYDAVLAEQIMAMLAQVRSTVMETLDVNGEELDRMMEDLDLSEVDLLDSQAIKKLVLYSIGTEDSTVLIVDEKINDDFRNLMAAVDNIRKDADIELAPDDIKKILDIHGMDFSDNKDETNIKDMAGPDQNDTAMIKAGDSPDKSKTDASKIGEDAGGKEAVSIEPKKAAESNTNQAEKGDRDESPDYTDGFEAFLKKLEASYEKPVTEFSEDTVRLNNIKEIASQMIEQIRVMAKPGQTTMELQLYPEHLGKVNLTISSNAEGAVSARFVVQNETAKEALEGQMITLKDSLAQQGIKVESIEVTIAGYSFEQNGRSDEQENMQQGKSQSPRKITFEEAAAMSEETADEAVAVHTAGVSGHNIDYTA